MKRKVEYLPQAEEDIFEIYKYILFNDFREAADHIFEKLTENCLNLSNIADSGHCPRELETVNSDQFLERHFKPYRIIYEIEKSKVWIHCVLDGHRDLQDLLERRLLR